MKQRKGDWGYIKRAKKKTLLLDLFLFAVPLGIFFSAWGYHGSRLTIWTVIAIVGCLPACKVLVNLLLLLPQKSILEEDYKVYHKAGADLTMLYELFVTGYEKNAFLDALAICGNQIVAFSRNKKENIRYQEKEIEKILRGNGFKVRVKIVDKKDVFLDRLASLSRNREDLRAGIVYTPREPYEDLSREEYMKHLLLAISM
ncbi:MAG TPA: hypothetical protein VIR32_04415 [Lachnospiraceae bacterium]